MSRHNVNEDGLILSGYHKKLKTMKKKFFVLYKETPCNVSRLEYFDNERKFKSGSLPKRTINLKHCFNINRRLDTKYDNVIALSTKDGGFGIVLETEQEMVKWLEVLISLQRSDANISDGSLPHFEHVWQVEVQKKGLAEAKGIVGTYHVCLTAKSVTFIRIESEKTAYGDKRISEIEILLTTIRRCGERDGMFYMEVGRQCMIGPGELWMETEDTLIAQNMNHMILSAMSAKGEAHMEPMRQRSSSANEASKPINVLQKRHTQQDNKINTSPQTMVCYGRERSDSLPSRNRTSSESGNQSFTSSSILTVRNNAISGLRPHPYQRYSNSPPIGCSESEESSISIDEPDDNGSFLSYRFNSRSSEGVIPEENTDELNSSESKCHDKKSDLDSDMQSHSLNLTDHMQHNYLSMAPVTNSMLSAEVSKSRRHISLADDTKNISSLWTLNRGCADSDLEFSEYLSDASKNFVNDMDIQPDRPMRAYSIGSKVEHNKMKSRLGNTNEADQSTTRVRAFSVGSRAKIPRCDLQRGVLFPKSMIEQNFNSNNNTYSVNDVAMYNQLFNISTNRDKKSTSAPLLNYKSPNSVDRMSDLMEIDFSKSSNTNTNTTNTSTNIANNQQHKQINSSNTSKTQSPRNASGSIRDLVKNYDTTTNRKEGLLQNCASPFAIKSVAKTDNGYLEMKPVGKHPPTSYAIKLGNSNSTSNEYLANKPKISDFSYAAENKYQPISNFPTAILGKKTETFAGVSYSGFSHGTSTNTNSGTGPGTSIEQQDDEISIAEDFAVETNKTKSNESNENENENENDNENESERHINHTTKSKSKKNYRIPSLSAKCAQLTLNSASKIDNKNTITDDYINVDGKATVGEYLSTTNLIECHDKDKLSNFIYDEECNNRTRTAQAQAQKTEKKRMQNDNKSGYEIIQIKSDSSLQTYKLLNRTNAIHKDKQQCQTSHIRPKSTNSSSLTSSSSASSSSTLCGCTSSSSTSCLNYFPASQHSQQATPIAATTTSPTATVGQTPTTPGTAASTAITKEERESYVSDKTNSNNSPNNKAAVTAATHKITSRPSSVTLEHELHYASLDLPQCNKVNVNVKLNKVEVLTDPFPVVVSNSLYAKIDFDHSDSSSTSSRNYNVSN